MAALLVASKYEEIYVPDLKDFVFISDNAYTKQEILEMEKSILITLKFEINIHSTYRFLLRFADCGRINKLEFCLAQYLCELTLIEQRMLVY